MHNILSFLAWACLALSWVVCVASARDSFPPHEFYQRADIPLVRGISPALPPDLFELIEDECVATLNKPKPAALKHYKGATNWIPLDSAEFHQPRTAIELAVKLLFQSTFSQELHDRIRGVWGGDGIIGIEWWTMVKENNGELYFHYDKDEGVASEEQYIRTPIAGSILYVSGNAGSPTVILEQHTPDGNNPSPRLPLFGAVSYPEPNKYVLFRGEANHGVVGSLGTPAGGRRVTLLINYWDKSPREPYSLRQDDSVVHQLFSHSHLDEVAALRQRYDGASGAGWMTKPLVIPPMALGASASDVQKGFPRRRKVLRKHGLRLLALPVGSSGEHNWYEYPAKVNLGEYTTYSLKWTPDQAWGPVHVWNLAGTAAASGRIADRVEHARAPVLLLFCTGRQSERILRKVLLPVAKEFQSSVTAVLVDVDTAPKGRATIVNQLGIPRARLPVATLRTSQGFYWPKGELLNNPAGIKQLRKLIQGVFKGSLSPSKQLPPLKKAKASSPAAAVSPTRRDQETHTEKPEPKPEQKRQKKKNKKEKRKKDSYRVTLAELMEREDLVKGDKPFVLTDGMQNWKALQKWNLEYFKQNFGQEITDYYPENMDKAGTHPWLLPVATAIDRFQHSDVVSYIHWRFGASVYRKLLKDMQPMSPWLSNNLDWFAKCLPKRTGSEWPLDNLILAGNFLMITIGRPGSGMFFHADNYDSGGWQASVVGRKRYVMCAPNKELTTSTNGFDPEFQKSSLWKKHQCVDAVVEPGEIAWWPGNWWHHTRCLDDLFIGITMRGWGPFNFRQDAVRKSFGFECSNKKKDITKEFPGASPPLSDTVCNSVDHCLASEADFAPFK